MKKRKSKKIDFGTSCHYALKDFSSLSHSIMYLALHGLLRVDFFHELSKIFIEFSECDSVEIWVKERGRYYRIERILSAKCPFKFEVMPGKKDENGKLIPVIEKDSDMELICRDIFLGRFDPTLPFFTKNGSFWIGDVKSLFASLIKRNGKEDPKKSFAKGNYKSYAILPISAGNDNIGLLQLKSKYSDFFTKEEVEFYEVVVQSLEIALKLRPSQVELRERVKELTCLYSIAKLVERPDISLKEILQSIVELLPPAWLYSEIASARIIVNGDSYTTAHFRESDQKQSADIVIDGERRGVVEVFYVERKLEIDEGPFFKEERTLIDTIAREVAHIIERKKSEEDKRKLQEQLRHADRLATIGQLSAGVAHELNEPISSILGFAQLANKNSDLSEQVKQDIEKIIKASLHAREVVKKLMLFARQTPPKKTHVNLNRIIEESLYFLESRCTKEGIKVVRSLSKSLPEVTADLSQLTQVFVNIVVNAIQAMPDGGELKIKTKATNEHVSLIVQDTGVGMSENIKKKIFLPFFTTKGVGQGTGLGLAVVHGIVSSHGGSINVESRVGEGTKFEIQLPIKETYDVKERH